MRVKHWKKFLWGGLCVLSLLGFWILYRGDCKTISDLTPQQAAKNWETEGKPYAMASVFLKPEQAVPQSALGEIYLSVEKALTDSGVGSENYPWFYAASYLTDASLRNGKASCEVELTAVAGDFFRMHPMEVINGWYMDEDDVMHDRIVLDRQTAWNLFYSDHVAGQYIEVNGVQYQVAAVVDTESGKYSEMAAGNVCRAWVFADSPALDGGSMPDSGMNVGMSAGMDASAAGYTCVEMVLPQPVKNFAASTMKNALGSFIPDQTVMTDNSGRFSLKNRWDILRNLGTRGISTEAVPYPYWENAARLAENQLALRLIPEGILLLFPAVSLLILLLWLNRRRTWGLHSIKGAVAGAVDRKHQREYEARLQGREPDRTRRHKRRRQEGKRSCRQRQKALQYAEKGRVWRRK